MTVVDLLLEQVAYICETSCWCSEQRKRIGIGKMMTIERFQSRNAQPRHHPPPPIAITRCQGYHGRAADFLRTSPQINPRIDLALEAFKHEKFNNLLMFDTYINARTCSRKTILTLTTLSIPLPPSRPPSHVTCMHTHTHHEGLLTTLDNSFARSQVNSRFKMVGLDKVRFEARFQSLLKDRA